MDLKPCPFCGSELVTIVENKGQYSVMCALPYGYCNAKQGWYQSKEQAIRAWNRRATNE